MYVVEYRAKTGFTITPMDGILDKLGVFIMRAPHGHHRIFGKADCDTTLQGAKEKAKKLMCKKREQLRSQMEMLENITICEGKKNI
jgi:hypothetical protein